MKDKSCGRYDETVRRSGFIDASAVMPAEAGISLLRGPEGGERFQLSLE
jgi:hypothetical protein